MIQNLQKINKNTMFVKKWIELMKTVSHWKVDIRQIKFLPVVSLLLLSSILIPFLTTSSSAGGDEIRVGVYQNPPLVLNDNGEIAGFYIDILEYIAEEEDWDIVYVYDTFPNLTESLRNGEIDLMTAIAYSEERSQLYEFNNETVLTNWGVICARRMIDSVLELEGLRIAVVKDDIYYEGLNTMLMDFDINSTFLVMDADYPDVIRAVENGTADCCVVSRLYAEINLPENDVIQTNVIFSPISLRFAAPPGKRELLEIIDLHLHAMKEDHNSIYYQSLDNWIGSRIEERVPEWLIYPLVIAPVVIAIIIGWNYTLRRTLVKKTAWLEESREMLRLLNKILRHDILNDITVISGNLELFKESEDGKFLEKIEKRLEKIEKLLRNVRALENAMNMEEPEIINLNDMLSELAANYDLPINIHGDCTVRCNKAIESVLSNIIENAIIHGKTDKIDIEITQKNGVCEIRIKDYGRGIPEEIRKEIFKEGVSYGGGSGLGLHIAKKIIELNGGSIWVEETSPHGATFVIRLKAE